MVVRNRSRDCASLAKAGRKKAEDRETPAKIESWTLAAEGRWHELLQPMVDRLLILGLPTDQRAAWKGRIQVGQAECLGIVPAIFKRSCGFVILLPYGFFDLLECFTGEAMAAGAYVARRRFALPKSNDPVMVSSRNFAARLRTVLGNCCPDFDSVTYSPSVRHWYNRVLTFVFAHEITHAIRNHFSATDPSRKRLHERAADMEALFMCLQAEEALALHRLHASDKELEEDRMLSSLHERELRRCRTKGEKGFDQCMNFLIRDYILACKTFFALAHILENTLGISRLARRRHRQRSHPTPRNRAMFLSLMYDQIARRFGNSRCSHLRAFRTGRFVWFFARAFLMFNGSDVRDRVKKNDRQGWSGRAQTIAQAMAAFS